MGKEGEGLRVGECVKCSKFDLLSSFSFSLSVP